jgi:transposase
MMRLPEPKDETAACTAPSIAARPEAALGITASRELASQLYGVGPITALALTCWLGGAGRFFSARKAVRFTGLDITVHSSDGKRSRGHLSRQGPEVLRWVHLRGRQGLRPRLSPLPRLLRAGEGPPRRQARRPVPGPPDHPPGLPHPRRARRRRARPLLTLAAMP